MKNIYSLYLLITLFALNISCEEDGGTSAIAVTNGALPNFTIAPNSSTYIVNSKLDQLTLNFTVNLSVGQPKSYDVKVLYKTIDGTIYGPITIDANATTFPKDYIFKGTEIVSTFPEINTASNLNAGDKIIFYTTFTMKDGTVLETLNNKGIPNYYASDFDQIGNNTYFLSYPIICAPQPGVYRIEMYDGYGDGWQTNSENGGNGIQLILDGVLTAEVGLCSFYDENPSYNCAGEYSNGTNTVTIPEGTEIATWLFPGDLFQEISFEIYGPNNELLLESGSGKAIAGPLSVVLCTK